LVGIEPNPGPSKNKTSSRRNNRSNHKSQSLSSITQRSFHIPTIKANTTVTRKFRYANGNTSFNGNITTLGLLNACGSICTTANTTGTILAQSCKLKEIEVWGAPQSNGGIESVSVEFSSQDNSSSSFSSSLQFMDTSINPSSPCYVRCKPPKGSQASLWQNTANDNKLFNLNIGANAIVDITLEYVQLDDNNAKISTTYSSGSATLGNIYYGYLDYNSPGTHTLTPIYLTSNY
jgi:hypothetical protein